MTHMSIREELQDVPTKRDWLGPFVAIFLAFVTYAIAAYTSYSANDKVISNRVSVVETQQQNDGKRLERMEFKLDQVLSALGKR